MLKKTHLALGLAAGITFYPFVNNGVLFLVVTMFSSLLPDIDLDFLISENMIIFCDIYNCTFH